MFPTGFENLDTDFGYRRTFLLLLGRHVLPIPVLPISLLRLLASPHLAYQLDYRWWYHRLHRHERNVHRLSQGLQSSGHRPKNIPLLRLLSTIWCLRRFVRHGSGSVHVWIFQLYAMECIHILELLHHGDCVAGALHRLEAHQEDEMGHAQ